jgi:hypothetical protein
MAVEFSPAAREYTIVFVRSADLVMPVVLLGITEGHNSYVTATGGWGARYVPAFVRRYPFVFSHSEDGTQFTLCIDESWAGCNEDGRGQRLFNGQGERTPYLDNVLSFLQEYNVQYARTAAFCGKLVDLDLLEPMQAQFTMAGGTAHALGGFLAVNRARLKALPDDQLATLARADDLELTYAHLQSMHNFPVLAERAVEHIGGAVTQNLPGMDASLSGLEATDPDDERVPAAAGAGVA